MTPRFLQEIPEYSSLLVFGPPGVGKLDYLLDAMVTFLRGGDRVIFVCIDISPQEVMSYGSTRDSDLSSHPGQNLLFIDCFTPSVIEEVGPEEESTILVGSFSNLEGMGMAIAKAAERLAPPVKILFYTISTLFLHNSPQSLSKFFQIVSARVKTQLGLILYACHEGVMEARQENLLRSLVDGVLELKFDDSMKSKIRLHHLRGHRIEPRWFPLEGEATEPLKAAPAQGIWSLEKGGREQ